MKYKNYRNSYSGDNRIYTNREIADMSVRDAFSRKEEILSQHKQIGIPSDGELKSSPNVVWVESYTRKDGTEVRGYWRSNPEDSGANNINDHFQKEDITKDKQAEQIKKENDEQLYPREIAGVKRNEPKTFEQMMQQGVNPKYMSDEDEKGEYSNNCACCTVAGELVQRGYNVEAGPADNQIAKELSKADESAYLDPATGKECIPEQIDIDEVDCFSYIDKKVKRGERYEFSYYTQRDLFYGEDNENAYNNQKTQGHIVLITRNEKNDLVWYDPQNGDRHEGADDVKAFLNSWVNERTLFAPRILRVDDKAINPKYVNSVVRKRKN